MESNHVITFRSSAVQALDIRDISSNDNTWSQTSTLHSKPPSHVVLFLPKHHSACTRDHVTDTEIFSFAMSPQCSPNWNRCGVMRRRWSREEGRYVVIMCTSHRTHVIGVCLPSQSASKKHNQKAHTPLRTSPWISPKMCLPCLIIIQSCYFDYRINKPFTCSRCVICVSCSVHLISTYYVRKGS